MSTLKERFEELSRLRPDVTQADLARAIGVKPPSVNAWFKGKTQTLKADTAAQAAAVYGVDPHWLATGKGQMHKFPQDVAITGNLSNDLMRAFQQKKDECLVHGSIQHLVRAHYAELSQPKPPTVNLLRTGRIPLLNKETAGMYQNYMTGAETPPDTHQHHDDKTEGLFAFAVDDDVMEPKIPNGCKAVINIKATPKHGSYVLIHDGDTSYIRRLVIDGSTTLVESPRYPARAMTGQIIGVVKEIVIWLD